MPPQKHTLIVPLFVIFSYLAAADYAHPQAAEQQPSVRLGPTTNVTRPSNATPTTSLELEDIANTALSLFESQGTGVKIQGLPQVRTELNGRDVFTVPNGHGLSWSDVSREWMEGVDTYKSPDASMIEGSVGGTYNIRTKQPLNLGSNTALYNLGVNYGDLAQELRPQLSALSSHRWGTQYGNFGWLTTIKYQETARQTDSFQLEPYIRRFDIDDTQAFIPRGIKWKRENRDEQHQTFASVAQWAPTPLLTLTLQNIVALVNTHNRNSTVGLRDSDTGLVAAENSHFELSPNGQFLSGQLESNAWRGDVAGNGVRLNGSTQVATRDNKTQEHSLAFAWVANNKLALQGDIQYVKAKTETLDFSVTTSRYVEQFYLDLRSAQPQLSIDANTPNHDEGYFWNSAMDHIESSQAELSAFKLDGAYQLTNDFGIRALRFGGRLSQEQTDLLDAGYNWGSLSDNWNLPLQYVSANHPEHTEYRRFDHFYRSDSAVKTGFVFPAFALVSDMALASQLLPNEIKSGDENEGWHADSFSFEDAKQVERNTSALYLMLKLGYEATPLGASEGHLGLRLVESNVNAQGFGEYVLLEDEGDTLDDAEQDFANGSFTARKDTDQTTHALPSAYIQFELSPRWLWRVAGSSTLARARTDQIRSYASVRAETETVDVNGEGVTRVKRWLGSTGNPQLKPVRVEQYDTSLEWNFAESGSAYTAAFYKKLRDSIERSVVEEQFTNNGQTRLVEVEKLINAGDSNIEGIEFGLRQKLGFLPGALRNIALQTAYTHMRSESGTQIADEKLPIEGLSKNTLSLSGTYQNQRLSITFNYNWRDDSLQSAIDLETNRPTWQKSSGRLGASVALRLSDRLQIALDGQNLGGSESRTERGPYEYEDGYFDNQRYANRFAVDDRQWRLTLRGEI